MVECPRCGHEVSELQTVTPDAISHELISAIDDADATLSAEHGMEVCVECMADLTRN